MCNSLHIAVPLEILSSVNLPKLEFYYIFAASFVGFLEKLITIFASFHMHSMIL